jgi:hypothetical protein
MESIRVVSIAALQHALLLWLAASEAGLPLHLVHAEGDPSLGPPLAALAAAAAAKARPHCQGE